MSEYLGMQILTLTDQERRVIARALNVTAAMMDALDEPGAVDVLALAERVCPEEDQA